MNSFKLNDSTLLIEGKRYLWSGISKKLYVDVIWKNDFCKISKIDHDKKQISVYEPFERKEYTYTFDSINEYNFKPWWKLWK